MQLFASRVSRRSICQTLPGTINAQDCEARNDAPPSSFGSCTTRTVRAGALAGPPFHETETGARKNGRLTHGSALQDRDLREDSRKIPERQCRKSRPTVNALSLRSLPLPNQTRFKRDSADVSRVFL
jgi:hypothetical protein